jgi:opacity protein-like surface antigen
MGGVSALKSWAICWAGAAALAAGVGLGAPGRAAAADALPPAPALGKSLGPAKEFSDWYLRADSGAAIALAPEPKIVAAAPHGGLSNDLRVDWARMRDGAFYGVGVGYRVNDFVRLDASAEHRLPVRYAARTSQTCAGARCVEETSARVQSGVFLANAYFEAITWHGLTPFVGAGVGLARNESARVNVAPAQGAGAGSGAGEGDARWAFAWALMAGVAYEPAQGVHVEMGYRYLDAGRVGLGRVSCATGCAGAAQRLSLGAHDVRLGLRFAFAERIAAR